MTRNAARFVGVGILGLALLPLAAGKASEKRSLRPGDRAGIAADSRLKRPLSLMARARPLGELLVELARELALPLEADREVADDKVSLFFREQPAGEMLALLAEKLGYHWVSRAGGYQLQQDLAWWQVAAAEEARAQETARRQLAELARLYETYLEKDPETLERIREQARHDLGRETDPARRHRLHALRRVAGDLTEPAVRLFLNVYRRMPEEARATLAAGRTASIRVDAKGPADEPITYEVQVRQVVEGRRAALVFRAPEAVYPDGDPAPRVVIEWRMETFPPPEERPESGAGNRSLESSGKDPRLKAGASSHTPEDPGRRTPALHAAVPPPLPARRVTITLKGSTEHKTPGVPLEPVTVERAAPGQAVVCSTAPLQPTIAEFAQAVALAADVPVIADGYTRPVAIPTVSGKPLGRLLDQFCERNDYRWEAADGWILLRSASPVLERRREVPERVVRGFREAPRQRGRLPLATLVAIAARLTDDQLEVFEARWPLYARRPETFFEIAGGISPWISRAGLRFYASLAESQWREATGDGLPYARMLPEQRRLFAAVFAEDPRTGQFATASPAQIATGRFRLRSTTQLVLLVSRGSSEWEPVSPQMEDDLRKRGGAGGDGRVLARLTRVAFAFHIGGQPEPRILFEYEETPVPF